MRAALHAGLLLRLARRRAGRIGVVLVYHRVGGSTRLDASVPEEVFSKQLRHVGDAYRVVRPADIVEAAAARRRGEPYPVAITFDDDVESHARTAKPALRAHDLPSAFFLTGRTLRGSLPFWWDDLERLGHAPTVPGASLREAAKAIERMSPADRAAAAVELHRAAPPDGDRGLSAADVRGLADAGFEIGFHTRDHDPAATLSDAELAAAVSNGREALAEAAGTAVDSFAYPHGRFDDRVVALVEEAGYRSAYTGAAVPVTAETNALLVPRYQAATTEDGLRLQLARACARAVGVSARI